MSDAGAAACRCIGHELETQSWWHVKVAGDTAPSVHVSAVEAEIVKPALHAGAHVAPCRMLTLLHVAVLVTALECSPGGT